MTHLKQELSTIKKREELSGVKKYQNHLQKKQDQIVTKQDQIHSTLKNDVAPPVMSTPPMAAGSHRSLSSSQSSCRQHQHDLDSLMNSVFVTVPMKRDHRAVFIDFSYKPKKDQCKRKGKPSFFFTDAKFHLS